MSLGADIAAALPALRAQAESRMTDTVKITRPTANPVFDTVTGTYPATTTDVYEGPARLKLASALVGDVEAQGQKLAGQTPQIHLPVATSGDVKVDDTVEVLTSAHDAALVGVRFNVEGLFFQTDATARRLIVEVQSS